MAHHDDDRWPSLAAELERLHRLAVPVPVPRVPHTDEDVGARINPGEIRELDVYWNAAINTRAAPAFPNLDDEVPISDTESVDIPRTRARFSACLHHSP